MDFDLSDTQRVMQLAARCFLGIECPPKRVRQLMNTDDACDATLWQGLAEQGWLGMSVPEADGGLGLSQVELAAVCEEAGRACLPGPFLSSTWGTTLLARAGDDAQRTRLMPALCEGRQRISVALLEDSAEWDTDAVRLAAEPTDTGVRLTGRKTLVSDAGGADWLIVVARGADGLLLALVDRKAPGVRVTATPAIDPTRKLFDVDLEGVEVSSADLLASGTRAAEALQYATDSALVATCAELLGGMQWMLESAVGYVQTRKQFGRPIGSFQAVQHQCADMLLLVESARSATYYAAWTLSENDPAAASAISIAKAYCSDAAREVGNRAVQVHGGIGFTWEHDLQLYYKRAKSNEIFLGDATYHRERLAEQILPAAG